MSFATDMLAESQSAYRNALSGKLTQLNGRRLEQHDIDVLLRQVEYWQRQVDAENARASGGNAHKPIQVVI